MNKFEIIKMQIFSLMKENPDDLVDYLKRLNEYSDYLYNISGRYPFFEFTHLRMCLLKHADFIKKKLESQKKL